MSDPDVFLGWNLGPSEVAPDRTQSRPARPEPRTRDLGALADPGDPVVADFLLPGDIPSGTPAAVAAETVQVVGGDASASAPSFPSPGEAIGGFRLVSELGRGAFGRVYLAEEAGLGNRPVALKVSRPEGDEPRLLARLQHTHIVPIHSVQVDPGSGLRLMCMPYFGGADLARVLEAAGARLPTEATGRSLVEALDLVGLPPPSDAGPGRPHFEDRAAAELDAARHPSGPLRTILARIPWWSRSFSAAPTPVDGRDPAEPARRFLREASFVRASAWIAARLAEGLDHAHSRGLLHRDLKPSNILIAADGTPMLLDFNLAADSAGTVYRDRAMVGGTLPYMAPEHLDTFHPRGSTPPGAVDERSDVYALGLILFEMVAGRPPFAGPPPGRPLLEVVRAMSEERRGPAPSPRAINREVSPGLDAIIRKAIDPEPGRRYARAGDLAEDLRRILDDRPLKYSAEPSPAEVLAKWARRNPKLTSGSTVALVASGLIALVLAGTFTVTRHLRQVSARLRLRVFEARFQECQFLLNTAGGPSGHLGRGVDLAEATLRQAGVDDRGRRASEAWLDVLAPSEQASMRRNLAELMLLVARARVARAERSGDDRGRRAALEGAVALLDEAERIDPEPPRALFEERARYHSALEETRQAARDRARAAATPPTTGRDFYLRGTHSLAEGRPDRAEPDLLRAVGRDDRPFWAWFALGLCHFDQGRFSESAGDFAVCTAIAPKFAWPWMNRGLALARAGRLVEAIESYNRALAVDEGFADALVNRGLARLEFGDAPAAAADLEKAGRLGRDAPPIRAALAEALARSGRVAEGLRLLDGLVEAGPDAPLIRVVRGTIRLESDPRGAEDDFRRALATDPGDPGAHLGLARLRRDDPRAALTELDLALRADPARLDAVEFRALLRARVGDPSAVADVDRLVQSPTPHRLYNAACALALLNEVRPDPALAARALEFLRRALDSGFSREPLRADPDLKSLRNDPAFAELTAAG